MRLISRRRPTDQPPPTSWVDPTVVRPTVPPALELPVPHPGAVAAYDPATGQIKVGTGADGQPARWTLFSPRDGFLGGLVAGYAGAGKTVLLDGIVAGVVGSRIAAVWTADLTGGQSPGRRHRADWEAHDRAEVLRQLRAAAAAVDLRAAMLGVAGLAVHHPTADEPGILLVIEDLHVLLNYNGPDIKQLNNRLEAIHLAEKIVRLGPKTGVAILAADQHLTLDTFGNSVRLRDALAGGNLALLRGGEHHHLVRQVARDGDHPDPRTLPNLPGAGYLNGHLFRGYYGADNLRDATPRAVLDPVLTGHLGDDYADRHTRAAARRAALLEKIRQLRVAAGVDHPPAVD